MARDVSKDDYVSKVGVKTPMGCKSRMARHAAIRAWMAITL